MLFREISRYLRIFKIHSKIPYSFVDVASYVLSDVSLQLKILLRWV